MSLRSVGGQTSAAPLNRRAATSREGLWPAQLRTGGRYSLDAGRVVPHGRPMTERFPGVREMFEANLAGGTDVGASFCVTVDGATVVDLWGGFADEARTRPWRDDTIVGVYSTTKTM